MSQRTAQLAGTARDPRLEITFGSTDQHPVTGESLSAWVRSLPAASRVAVTRTADDEIDEFTWQLQCLSAAELLADAGYTVPPAAADLIRPLAGLHPTVPGWARVLPRLTDVLVTGGLLPDTALYDPGSRSWEMPIADLAFVDTIDISPALHRAMTAPPAPVPSTPVQPGRLSLPSQDPAVARAAHIAAKSDGTGIEAEIRLLTEYTGGIPDWFGLDLDPFQIAGALAAAAGHRLIGDSPGLGKTRQILCAAAIMRPKKVIILTPPTVVTHWGREAEASHLADNIDSPGGVVLSLRSTRKIPPLPDAGVLIVPDTLIASRPALLAELVAWGPDVVALDEAHRIKTWESKRGRACRKLANAAALRIAASGTPMFANTEELAGPLDFADLLRPFFGSYEEFTTEYARLGKFGWTAQKKKLPQLKSMLDSHCWVRRTKEQVMKNLPPKRRVAEYIDVDVKLFTQAHAEVNKKIDAWLRQFSRDKSRMPDVDEVDAWTQGQMGLVTLMRKAAGLAKIPVAAEMITDWVRDTTETDADGRPIYTRPLIVWTHHHEVSEAMAKALPVSVGQTRSIVGGTPQDERTKIVDDFQAGLIPVLVASIHAAGVGLTLTRSSDAIVCEADWTPALLAQAEDRIHRRGATRPCTITTLIAPGTLDEQIQGTLARKAKILEAVMSGADHHVATSARDDDFSPGASILSGMVRDRAAILSKRGGRAA